MSTLGYWIVSMLVALAVLGSGTRALRVRDRLSLISPARRIVARLLLAVAWFGSGTGLWVLAFGPVMARESRHRYRVARSGREDLKALANDLRSYYQEHDVYSDDPSAIGFAPDPESPYTFQLGSHRLTGTGRPVDPSALCQLRGTWPDGSPLAPGLHGKCPAECDYAALSAWQNEQGATVCYSITSFPRLLDGQQVPENVVVDEPAK